MLVDYFKKAWAGFPGGKLEASESPDFLLKPGPRFTIGIELTRLYPESKSEPTEKEMNQTTLEEKLVARTRDFFEAKSPFKCFAKFVFPETELVREEQIFSGSIKIAGRIFENTKTIKQGRFNQIIIKNDLPAAVDSVLILSHPLLKSSVWERSNNLGVSSNLLDDIKFSIHKKDEKLRIYKKQNLNEYWLLITTDKLQQQKTVNIPGLMEDSDFESRFKKVFVLELITGKVTELV